MAGNSGKKHYSVFKELFDLNVNHDSKHEIDSEFETGLLRNKGLNYMLQSCLYTDNKWVLCMVDVDHDNSKEKDQLFSALMNQFCGEMAGILQGFKLNSNRFAFVVYCKNELDFAGIQMNKLLKRIDGNDIRVSIGIAKRVYSDNFIEWKQRSVDNMNKIKQSKDTHSEDSKDGNRIYSDINITKTTLTKQRNNGAIKKIDYKFGTQDEFECTMNSIVFNQDKRYHVALLNVDNLDRDKMGQQEQNGINKIEIIETEIVKLIKLFGDFANYTKAITTKKDNCMMEGYKISSNYENDDCHFGIILFVNDCSFSVEEIVHSLIENISFVLIGCNVKCSISAGFSAVDVKNSETCQEWRQRLNKYLSIAKQNGGNQMYCGKEEKTDSIAIGLNSKVNIHVCNTL